MVVSAVTSSSDDESAASNTFERRTRFACGSSNILVCRVWISSGLGAIFLPLFFYLQELGKIGDGTAKVMLVVRMKEDEERG